MPEEEAIGHAIFALKSFPEIFDPCSAVLVESRVGAIPFADLAADVGGYSALAAIPVSARVKIPEFGNPSLWKKMESRDVTFAAAVALGTPTDAGKPAARAAVAKFADAFGFADAGGKPDLLAAGRAIETLTTWARAVSSALSPLIAE